MQLSAGTSKRRRPVSARVIGIGQPAAGDDAVGIAVLQELRKKLPPGKAELVEAADPAALAPLLENAETVILVDAVAGASPGAVVMLDPERFSAAGFRARSSHRMALAQAIELARGLAPESVAERILIVGVGVLEPEEWGSPPSAEVSEAVPRASAEVLRILEDAT
jgi:hydrogenase maturation protease